MDTREKKETVCEKNNIALSFNPFKSKGLNLVVLRTRFTSQFIPRRVHWTSEQYEQQV